MIEPSKERGAPSYPFYLFFIDFLLYLFCISFIIGYWIFLLFLASTSCGCPDQKRILELSMHISEDVCFSVSHRQFVWTIPKRFRIFFRYDRDLLKKLPKLAWEVVCEIYKAVLDRDDIVPGMIAAVQTFGELAHFHSHVHAVVTDGAFTNDG